MAFVCFVTGVPGQTQPAPPALSGGLNDTRILGVIPNYQTVNDPDMQVAPLTAKQKFDLFAKEALDPFNVASAAIGSSFSQAGNETPKYGRGKAVYAERFGAALGDMATQNLFSACVLASVLHHDPRYFRKGPKAGVLARVAYSVSRLAIARQDSGRETFNASGIFGMMLGIAASNAYYPSASVHGSVMAGRLTTSLTGGAIGNLTSEFWPDIQRKFFHRRHGS
jgi:hypothetical protein